MEFDKVLFGRRSVRQFVDKDVSDNDIKRIIEAGIYAPSACNLQDWKFILVRDKNRDAYYNEIVSSAPVLIFVTYRSDNYNVSGYKHKDYVQSAAAAIQNMLLKAYSLGLGTCWICDLPSNSELQKHFDVPSNYEVLACIAVGYPVEDKENTKSQLMFHGKSDSCHLLTSRKYSVNEVLYYEKFGKSKIDEETMYECHSNCVRDYWIRCMLKIATPVLENCASEKLHKNMPKVSPNMCRADKYSHLEALARTILGISPWLECDEDNDGNEKERYRELARRSIENSVSVDSADYMNWDDGDQPLVDVAFLALGILQAKSQLWDSLSCSTQEKFLNEIKKTRKISPWRSNWILFSAMIETFIYTVEGEEFYNRAVIDYAIFQFEQWYIGDGFYKDGDNFHFDYYESIVIHPFLIAISQRLPWLDMNKYLIRGLRYSKILENMIAKDGTYPLIGRSLCYRGGVFHLLAQLAYTNKFSLANESNISVSPSEVRTSLTSVLNRIMSDENFDENGWLRIGVNGEQMGLAEEYINTGSLYMLMSMFVVTGATGSEEFWASDKSNNYSMDIWAGLDKPLDNALEGWARNI